MIKKTLRGKNLKDRLYDFIDTDSVSKDYFRVDLPEKFYIGKNGFSINPTQQLLKGSSIEIDILDVRGNYVYYEITDILTETNSRLISVYIYPDIELGDLTFYISGITKDNKAFVWISSKSLSWQEVPYTPIFDSFPKLIIQETYQTALTEFANRGFTSSYSDGRLLSIGNRSVVPQSKNLLINDKLPNLMTPVRYITKDTPLDLEELIIGNKSLSGSQQTIAITTENPKINYNSFDNVTINSSYFTQNMYGGSFIINLKDQVETIISRDGIVLPVNEPFKNYYSSSLIYTSSIFEVIDDKNVKLYPKFEYNLEFNNVKYLTFNTLQDYENFTASYSRGVSSSIKPGTGGAVMNTSYLHFQFHNLDPVVGKVDNIEIGYRKKTSFKTVTNLAHTDVVPVDLFIDSSNYTIKKSLVDYKSFGSPSVNTDVSESWATTVYGNITASFEPSDRTSENGIIFVSHSGVYNSDYFSLYTTSSYDFVGLANTSYNIQFEAWHDAEMAVPYQGKYGNSTKPLMEVYLSGSEVQLQPQVNKSTTVNSVFGNYLGSLNTHTNFFTSFSPKQTSLYKIYFIVKGGAWKIKKLKVSPESPFGFTPNVYFLKVPTPTDMTNKQVDFEIYFGNRSNYSKPLIISNFHVSGAKL